MTRAVALWGARIPCGGTMMPAAAFTEFPAAVQITMAAIDPTAESKGDGPKRATLRIIRRPLSAQYPGYDSEDDSDEDSEDDSEDDEDESEDEKPKKGSKKAEKMDVDSGKKEEDEDSDEDEDGLEIEEFVLCTLDAEKNYQQPLVITMNENEEVYFRVNGTYDVFLTGNYVVGDHDHDHDEDSESDEDYDLSPSEDEFDFDEDSEDDLDDLANPRIQEVDSEEEAPKKEDKKDESKLSKKEKKALKRSADEPAETSQKKQKGPDGKPVSGDTPTKDKKVKFAKNLEQGPTPSPAQKKDEAAPKKKDEKKDKKEKKEEAPKKAENKTRVVNGVTIVEAIEGSGPQAKNGQKISVRYIGKLQKNGKQFDANTSGKPFSFTLGKGEVIKGWDIGMAGMRVGGSRTLTIPPNLAYGNQSIPGIPKGSTLIFEVKCLGIK